jgi:hypothetical protein
MSQNQDFGPGPSDQNLPNSLPQSPQVPGASTAEPPLNMPWYGIGIVDAVKRFFKKYATFNGRASRGEFWWVALAIFIVMFILNLILSTAGSERIDYSDVGGTFEYTSNYNTFGTILKYHYWDHFTGNFGSLTGRNLAAFP